MIRFIILVMLSLTLLSGCSGDQTMKSIKYEGRHLDIGIVGTSSLPKFKNVTYEKVDLKSLIHDTTQYDALIIMKDAFPEADKDEYVPFFNEIKYPVFFFGIEGFKLFAFTTKGMTMDMAKNENSAYVQGFKNETKGNRTQWGFYLPNDSNDTDVNKYMMEQIFNRLQ
jgi:hypothetical protein